VIDRNVGRQQIAPDEMGESAFTLLEVLIVIVVLGVLAAVVIFALGGVTGKTAVAACDSDGATVSSAISAFYANNPNTTASPTLLIGSTDGGPYIQSWPNNLPHYAFEINSGVLWVSIAPAGAVTGSGSFVQYKGPASCDGVT
jgi:general secretion pathway protein G